MGLLEDFGFSEDDNSSYEPEVQEENGVLIPAPEGAPTDVSALRRGGSNDELRQAIVATAAKLGIDPHHLATAISYETGGTFDPWKRGPTTQWGTHRGLIQWGEPQARQYGVSADTSVSDQLNAVGRYLVDRGVKPGMGLLDVYSAINAGRVGLYDRSDANNGGAPGTVRDKVEKQMGAHRSKAAALLGGMNAIAYAPEEPVQFPNYSPPTGPRRAGAAPGVGYISNDSGGWTPAGEEPPKALFYGPVRQNTNQPPAYIRGDSPGLQKGYVPPEMRGPFRASLKVPYSTAVATVGAPVTDSTNLHLSKLDPTLDYPGLPQDIDEDNTIPAQLAALLQPSEPVAPVLDESAGLNLAKTAPNISFASTQPEAPLPAPILNLPSKDQDSLLVTKGKLGPDAPSVPISGDNMPAPSFFEAELPDNKPPPASFMDMVNAAVNPVKHLGSKALGQATALPFVAGGMLSAIFDQGANTGGVTSGLLKKANDMERGMDYAFGVPETGVTIGDKAMGFLGKVFTPFGRHTAIATALNGVAVGASEMIQGAQAKQAMTKAQAERLLFPGIGNNAQGGADEFATPLVGPRVTHTVQTAAGPATLDEPNFRLLGYMGAATIGALVAPSMARRILATSPFQRVGRMVEASPGVMDYTNRMDFIRTQDDKYAGIMRQSRDLGVDPIALDEMQKVFDFSTGSGARNLTNSAVVAGKMESPNFSYQVQVPIGKLVQVEAQLPQATEYMHLWNTLDEIRSIERGIAKKGQNAVLNQSTNAGPVAVRGMTSWDARQAIQALEASPEGQALKDYRTAYLDNQRTLRNFEAQGEYGMYTKRELQELNRYELNKVHQKLDTAATSPGIGHNNPPGPVADSFGVHQTEAMRVRMENEAKGLYIDNLHRTQSDAVQKLEDIMGVDQAGNPIVFKSVAKQLEENASWKANAVTFYRRGVKETWITSPFIADVLKMDPYMASGSMTTFFDLGRNAVEKTTTGVLAPWFSTTSMIRNHMLIKHSASAGFATPNALETLAAIPQQWIPRASKDIATRLDHWANGWLGQVYGPQNVQGLATKLAQVYEQSTYAALSQRGGVHTGMFLDYNKQAAQSIGQALQSAPAGLFKTALEGLKATFESIHGSANFAYARKNIRRGVSANEAAMETRRVTGNNTKSGQLRTREGRNIRFEDPNASILGRVADDYARIYGQLHEAGRQSAPWWNVTTQGMKAVGKAYLDNPGKFIANSYLYSVMPSAAVWFYNRGLGTDPNGISYTDYQMNRRTPYDSLMNMYIAIPGKPAEEGIRIPLPHEMASIFAVTAAAMHHMTHTGAFDRPDDFMRTALALVGKDYNPSNSVPIWSAEQDFGQIIKKAAEVALFPAAPPAASMVAAAGGFTMPEGPFGGAYKKKEELNDQNGMNASYELMMRAIAPGLADVVFSGWAGMTMDPDEISAWTGAKSASRRLVEKMPVVRDAIGWQAPVTGSTRTTAEMFDDKGTFAKIDRWYKNRDPDGPEKRAREGRSKQGNEVASMFMPEAPPTTSLGKNRPSPNQLYDAFMEELHAKLGKDTITESKGENKGKPSGGIGFLSHMERYFKFTELIKNVRNNDTLPTWTKRIAQEPGLQEYFKKNNIDYTNPRLARNFLEHERQTAARQIMFTLRAVEQDFGRRLGDPNFKFEKLDPLKPTQLPMGFVPTPFKPQLPSYWMGK